jgi:hypothetical protein
VARPPIPARIKRLVWDRDRGHCTDCTGAIAKGDEEYDHRPPLGLRLNDPEFPDEKDPRHYIPNANDPAFIFLKHGKKTVEDCHKKRTFGDGPQRGDVTEIARTKKGLRKRAEKDKPRKRWGSRKIRSNPIIPGSKKHYLAKKYSKAQGGFVTVRREPKP